MVFTLETYMDEAGLAEADRQLLRKQARHSISCYGLAGEHFQNDFDKEDLLAVLMGMERFVLDTNSLWTLRDASLPANRNKAFILGHTVAEEVENCEALLFGRNVDNSNDNVFSFEFAGQDTAPVFGPHFIINRLDSHYRDTFDRKALLEESRERAKRTDREFLERERTNRANVLELKRFILDEILCCPDVASLTWAQCEQRKLRLVHGIRSVAASCRRNWWNALRVASSCYAALLLEQDIVGQKTLNEFRDPARRNVFGDTRLIGDALWLDAGILSKDAAVKRMVDFLGLASITVAERP